jgi:DNA-directed RNA polymerase specialized sigma24 family protein
MVDPFVSVFGSPQATRQVPHWFAAASSDLTSRTKQSALLVGLDRGYLNDRMPSQELVKRALAGERAAIEALVVELSPVVQARVAAALYRCGHSSRQELEDLTQEILMDLFTGEGRVLSSWDPERGLSLASFVGLVAQRQVYSRLRSRRRSPFTQRPTDPSAIDASLTASEPAHAPEEPLAAREMLRLLFARLHAELSPKALEMFYRLYVWQQEPELIAHETGSKLDAIYQWRSRLKKEVLELETSLLRQRESAPNLVVLRSPTHGGSDASS